MSRGVLYMASGEQYVEEARTSAASVREHMDCEIAIATDDTARRLPEFDHVIERDAPTRTIDGRSWLIDSTVPSDLSPFDETLYLDSDTWLTSDVSGLFDLLDAYDLAVARTPSYPSVDGCDGVWGQFNCGVIAYRDTPGVRSFLSRWRANYVTDLADGDPRDQPSFARTLHDDETLRWFTLPRKYNVRVPGMGELTGRAKILHGRHPAASLEEIAAELNHRERHRTYSALSYWTLPTHTITPRNAYRYNVEKGLSENGVAWTAKRTVAYVSDRLLGTDLYGQWFDAE